MSEHDAHDHDATCWAIYESPIGPLTLIGGDEGLQALRFPGQAGPLGERPHRPAVFRDAIGQLEEYFAGERRRFDLTLDVRGTAFQQRVWQHLVEIPYGSTTSYRRLAAAMGRPDRVRAVGGAIARTPVPIVVPCHRVVASDGALTGYLGGLERKRALLDLEDRGA
jgi:methylated-DNA-[protein]-cysteine S-methyltransferase